MTTSMRGTQRDHESNLDALLEDLQTTVSRSNSNAGLNGQVTGYRSFRRTATDGTPEGTSTEYQIEYLNPANSTHQMVESSYNGSANGHKNERYKYKTVTSSHTTGDHKMKQNISELDSLLEDLNASQRKNFSNSSYVTKQSSSGIDSGFLDPVSSGSNSGSRLVERIHKEEKTSTSLRGRSPSPRARELIFTGHRSSRDPSPVPLDYHTSFEQREESPNVQQFYRYEKTTSTRTTAPVVTTEYPSSYDGNGSVRSYSIEEVPTLAIRDRSPSPINRPQIHSTSYSSYSTTRDNSLNNSYKDKNSFPSYPASPEPENTPRYGTTKTAYSYSSNTRETTRTEGSKVPPPPPHRSPSPVSFQQPPLPGSKNSRSYSDSSPPPTRRSHSPQRFSPSDPSNKMPYNVSPHHASHTYKTYSATTTTATSGYNDEPHSGMKPRPFPTSVGDQQPPKKLDDLMATISDGTPQPQYPHHQPDRYSETNVHRYTTHHTSSHNHTMNDDSTRHLIGNGHPSGPPKTPEPTKTVHHIDELKDKDAEREKLIARDESKGVAGPPVYYPPGVELFCKKEESMMQKEEGGAKYKAMAKYEYEAKSKSKHTESSGKAVVPVCLPVCCAMPCSIM